MTSIEHRLISAYDDIEPAVYCTPLYECDRCARGVPVVCLKEGRCYMCCQYNDKHTYDKYFDDLRNTNG